MNGGGGCSGSGQVAQSYSTGYTIRIYPLCKVSTRGLIEKVRIDMFAVATITFRAEFNFVQGRPF